MKIYGSLFLRKLKQLVRLVGKTRKQVFAFFMLYLAVPQPILGQYQGGSPTHSILITVHSSFNQKVTRILVTLNPLVPSPQYFSLQGVEFQLKKK